jgi:hypothetical protein
MPLNDPIGNIQPQPGARDGASSQRTLGREEGLEQPFLVLFADAAAGIRKRDLDSAVTRM